jgi:hypothetical protein
MKIGIEEATTDSVSLDIAYNALVEDAEAGFEGMFVQELFNGEPFSHAFLATLIRLETRLNRNINQYAEITDKVEKKLMESKSIHLLRHKDTIELIDGLEALQDVILDITGKGTNLSQKDIVTALKKLGIDGGKNPYDRTNWTLASSGAAVRLGAVLLGFGVTSGNPFVFVAGAVAIAAGKTKRSIRQYSIQDRGWDLDKLTDANKRTLSLIENHKKVIAKIKTAAHTNVSDNVAEQKKDEFKAAGIIMKKVIKFYKKTIAVVARGLGNANIDKIEFKRGMKDSLLNRDSDLGEKKEETSDLYDDGDGGSDW